MYLTVVRLSTTSCLNTSVHSTLRSLNLDNPALALALMAIQLHIQRDALAVFRSITILTYHKYVCLIHCIQLYIEIADEVIVFDPPVVWSSSVGIWYKSTYSQSIVT